MHNSIRVNSIAPSIRRITTAKTKSTIATTSRLKPPIAPYRRPFSTTLTKPSSPTLNQNLKDLWGITNSTSSKMATQKTPNEGIPKHEMVYLKGLASSARDFGEFRRVLFTGLYSQVVVMEIPVGGEIGDEVHTVDQVLIFTAGQGLATIAGKDQEVDAGDVVIVPAGTQHQFVTRGDKPLELITIYSPAEHNSTTVHKDKVQADEEEDNGKDEAPAWAGKSKAENEKAGLVRESGKYDD